MKKAQMFLLIMFTCVISATILAFNSTKFTSAITLYWTDEPGAPACNVYEHAKITTQGNGDFLYTTTIECAIPGVNQTYVTYDNE